MMKITKSLQWLRRRHGIEVFKAHRRYTQGFLKPDQLVEALYVVIEKKLHSKLNDYQDISRNYHVQQISK